MRNVFDQYTQPENRLTHALLCSLDEDRRLLHAFVRDFLKDRTSEPPFEIYEQSLPGEQLSILRNEGELDGLPDGCLVARDGRAWLIESKVASHPSADQLRRHRRSAKRHGLDESKILVLTTGRVARHPIDDVIYRTWAELYRWLSPRAPRSKWAERCARYLEAAEARFPHEKYRYEGTLTVFAGIPFGTDHPYQYAEAKRHLDLLRRELLGRGELVRKLGIDRSNKGRAAVTGSKVLSVWDFISLKHAGGKGSHTKYPHLTLAVQADRLEAYVTVPNGVASSIRTRLFSGDKLDFERRVRRVTASIEKAVRGTKGVPRIGVVQRRYRTQSSPPFVDATLRFDPRTAFDDFRSESPRIRRQPQWLDAVYHAMRERRSNLQFQIGAEFSYGASKILRSPKIVEVIERVWLACEPFIAAAPYKK